MDPRLDDVDKEDSTQLSRYWQPKRNPLTDTFFHSRLPPVVVNSVILNIFLLHQLAGKTLMKWSKV